jgi:hypothetical protein
VYNRTSSIIMGWYVVVGLSRVRVELCRIIGSKLSYYRIKIIDLRNFCTLHDWV